MKLLLHSLVTRMRLFSSLFSACVLLLEFFSFHKTKYSMRSTFNDDDSKSSIKFVLVFGGKNHVSNQSKLIESWKNCAKLKAIV